MILWIRWKCKSKEQRRQRDNKRRVYGAEGVWTGWNPNYWLNNWPQSNGNISSYVWLYVLLYVFPYVCYLYIWWGEVEDVSAEGFVFL